MPIDYTSTALIDSITRRALIPTSQALYASSDLCNIASEELQADIVPLIMAVREDYLVANYDQAIDTTNNKYYLPPRSVGLKLRDVVLLNSNGKEISLPRVEPDQMKHSWWYGAYSFNLNQRGFYFEDDHVLIFPDTASLGTYSLRMKYFRRPNRIVPTSSAAQITTINTGTKVLSFTTTLPTTWAVSTTFDIIKGTPTFRSLGEDLAISAIDTLNKTITLSAAVPSGVVVGDWVAEAGFSPIPQIPYEIHQLLAQRCAIKVLEGMGDQAGLQAAGSVYTDMVDKFQTLVTPRSDGSPKRFNRGSHFFGGTRHRGPWW